jgi:transcriptional regulator with XRE-family HTH domain
MPKTIFSREQETLQELLCALRKEKGLTQEALAKRLGVPQSFVSKYESGERRLDLIELRQVCAAAGLSLSAFIRRFEAKLGAEG